MSLIDLMYHVSVLQPCFMLNSLCAFLLFLPIPFLALLTIYTHYMDKRIGTHLLIIEFRYFS